MIYYYNGIINIKMYSLFPKKFTFSGIRFVGAFDVYKFIKLTYYIMYAYIDIDDVTNPIESHVQRIDVDEIKINNAGNDINNIDQAHDKG